MAAAAGHKRSIVWGSGSTPAWRVLIALKEKELPYESDLIEFSKGKFSGLYLPSPGTGARQDGV